MFKKTAARCPYCSRDFQITFLHEDPFILMVCGSFAKQGCGRWFVAEPFTINGIVKLDIYKIEDRYEFGDDAYEGSAGNLARRIRERGIFNA